jgi:hypothetical protein
MEPPPSPDARAIEFAMIGYAFHQPISKWSVDAFEFVAQREQELNGFIISQHRPPQFVDKL